MKSRASGRFWKHYHNLPPAIQRLATEKYRLWRQDAFHPSLGFKRLNGGGERFSVRVGEHHRAIGQKSEDGVEWVWIGSHEDYNKLVG
jgi:hypothetical protein